MPDLLTLDYRPAASRFAAHLKGYGTRLRTQGGQMVREEMDAVRSTIVATTPVDTGALRRSWSPVRRRGDALTWGVSTDLPYAPILEYGGYRGVGPKTVALGGGDLGESFVAGAGIYSKQAPLGWVRRALAQHAPHFRQQALRLVQQHWGAEGEHIDMTPSEMESVFGIPIVTHF